MIKVEAVRIEPPVPQEPKEPVKQIPKIEEPAQKIETEDLKQEAQKPLVVVAPAAVNKVDEKPPPPPVKVLEPEASQSGGEKQLQAEAPAAPVQAQASEKHHEQVSLLKSEAPSHIYVNVDL